MAAYTVNLLPVVVQSGDGKVFQFPGEPEAQQFEKSAQEAGGETSRLVPALPLAARPLYELETRLMALLATEEAVPSELVPTFTADLQATQKAVIEKRDRVGQFVLHLKSQIEFAHSERKRLEQREALYARTLDRVEAAITRVIESLPVDGKNKRRKLEGQVCTLSLHGCDKRVDVTDEAAVPTRYKRATVTLPAETWELVCDSLDLDLRDKVLNEVKSPKIEVSNSLAKVDLKAGLMIPGCSLAGGFYVVVK